MLKRLVAGFVALSLIGFVIASGYWATSGDTTAVVVFGLASALLAPIGLSSIGFAIGLGQDGLITRLARVPEIEELAARAATEAERLAILQKERSEIAKIVEQEVRRGVLLQRRDQLEVQGRELLATFETLDQELADFPADDPAMASSTAISNLRSRLEARRRGDIVISLGGRSLVIDTATLTSLPFGGVLVAYLRFASRLLGS